jgi:hypothetical protein
MVVLIFAAKMSFSQGAPGLLFGGADNDAGYSIATTNTNGYVLAGSTRNNRSGSWDAWAIQISETGKTDWIKTYGWEHHDHFSDVIALEDGYLFVGHIWDFGLERLDIYLVKTDLLGEKIFDQLYGTNRQDMGFSVLPSVTGGFLVLGYTRDYELHGNILLIKIDEAGNEVWRNNYGSDYDDYAYSLVEGEDGTITLFGSLASFHHDIHYSWQQPSADWVIIRIDQDGNETTRYTFNEEGHDFARKILHHEQGGYYLMGSSQSYGAGSFDMILKHVGEDGYQIWRKTYGGADYEYGMSMDINYEGDLYLFGTTRSLGYENSPDYYLVKVDHEGEQIWSLTLGGEGLDYGQDVVATADGGCAIIGHTQSFGEGGFDMMMVKVDKHGVIEYLIEGVDSAEHKNLLVYPNPVRSAGRILPESTNATYQLDLVSLNGVVVRSYLIEAPNFQFNVETLTAGMYIYRITKPGDNKFLLSGKLLKR